MARESAGILLYRFRLEAIEVFLIHIGGPFWQNKDANAWSIPKGELDINETPLKAAIREFEEETGTALSNDNFIQLTTIQQKGGKLLYTWAKEGDLDASHITSNTFKQEWPPHSGKWQTFPEADKAAWFTVEEARKKIDVSQEALLDELVSKLKAEKRF